MTRMRKLTAAAGAVIATAYGGTLILHNPSISANDFGGGGSHLDALRKKLHAPDVVVPSRESHQSALIAASKANPLDVLVIGGGATGAGAALDAVTRGLNVGLVEREDFASGTSSRSTKLLHGGVRYLEKAVFNLDYGQYKLVLHALDERKQEDNCCTYQDIIPQKTGAAVLNHAEVVSLLKDDAGKRIIGARVRDNLTGKEFDTYAKVIVNASGPFCDALRKMADKNAQEMIAPSSGVHIILPDYYSPEGMGLIVPKTKDGRVVFMLPWMGRTIAGTTDSNTSITYLPEPHEDEIQFILDAISDYLNVKVRRTDVLSAWSGIRPLAVDPTAKSTESISRDHVVCEDYPGLVTITGGKWTTYRSMAEDAVNAAIKSGKLTPANGCVTNKLCIVGGEGWELSSFTVLAQQYKRMKSTHGGKVVPGIMDSAAAKHLSHAYGTLAERVAAIAQNENLGKRLAHGYPYLEAEVAYCARNEYCESAIDFIARRTRLAFLETDAAKRALPRVIEILANEHEWDDSRKKEELQKATDFLKTFKSSQNAQFCDGKHH
ncbi:unnamed protein product [Vicia faba]|uniref:Glycerol-3-phosphate dehydrogenase n=1 Tax=Vicia faba TaxID=3906 RepID=A0AAV1A392_VICFA|nr:unnamed protein product [Vicia faba]